MRTVKPLDIVQECAALFNQEDTLAWFDFHCAAAGGGQVEGLCRIAHPKKSAGGKEYVSLIFVIDTPDGARREQVAAGLRQLGRGGLEKLLPEISAVVSDPAAGLAPDIYIKQFDLMLKELFTASREFIGRRLYPALCELLCLSAGELCWWENMNKEQAAAPEAAAPEPRAPKTIIARLREKLFGR